LECDGLVDVVVVGGGAGGLVVSIALARRGVSVQLLEKNSTLGRKIRISGNGKCNISNRHITPQRFHSHASSFIDAVLEGYGFEEIEAFFASIGLVLVEGEEGRVYPLSLQAISVVDLLVDSAMRLGVEVVCDCEVFNASKEQGVFTIDSSRGEHRSRSLVIASGSPAFGKLGASAVGYEIAKGFGHALHRPLASLVPLCSDEAWVASVAGVKINAVVTLYANGDYITQRSGDILFTKYGISGLAILDLSYEVSRRLDHFEYCELSIDLMPTWSKERLSQLFLQQINPQSSRPIALWLEGFLHKKLIPIILSHAKSRASVEHQLHRKEINRLVHAIKNLPLSISSTKGLEMAEVAIGGVDTTQINSQTMESMRVKNLFFVGEVIDVDGDRGGFNFHFAWASALRLAKAFPTS
jgi:predicted Rossmann fold flavoprotein